MPNVFAKSLLGLVAALVAASASSAQDTAQLFNEGVQLLRLNKRDEALVKFQELLKADPSNEAAFKLWKETDQDIWTMLLSDKDDVSKVARHLLSLAQMGKKALSRDEGKIKELVEKACSAEFETRRAAMNTLIGDHGEFAVPALVEKLGNADDDKGQTYASLALHYMGRRATLPLVAALHHENVLVRRNAAAALAHIRDPRAAAGLARLLQDSNEAVRTAAKSALAAMGVANANAVDIYLDDGRRLLSGAGVLPGDLSEVTWSLDKAGKLVASDVPANLYSLELAKNCAHEALVLDPASEGAQVLLAQSCLAQSSTIADSSDEATKAWGPKVAGLEMMAMMTGPKVLGSAVQSSIKDGLVQVAAASIKALGQAENRDNLANSPLVAALDNSDKRISYAAALALTEASKGRPVPAADKVVAVLGSAITEEAVRVVKVIDSTPSAKGVAVAASGKRGTAVEATTSGARAVDELRQFAKADVIVINEKLTDTLPDYVLGLLRKDPRFAETKFLIIADDPEKAKATFGDKIHGAIKGPLTADELNKAVDAALKDAKLDSSRSAMNAFAVSASAALADLGASKVDLGGALGNLCAQLTRADDVAIPAANAIGEGGSAAQLKSLAEVVKNEGASAGLRAAAAGAVGKILGRTAEAPADLIDPMLAVLGSGADAKVKAAVVGALGKGKFAPGERLKMVETLRSTLAAPAAAPATEKPAGEPKS